VAIGATLLSVFLCLCGLFLTMPRAYQGLGDFRQFYTAGYMARTGQSAELHDFAVSDRLQTELAGPAAGSLPFNHLAVESLLFAPLSLLSYRAAYIVFLVFNGALLVGAFFLFRPYLRALSEIWRSLPAAAFFGFLPVTLALTEGQDSILLLLLFVMAYRAWDEKRELVSGTLVGLTLFKFQYGLPIVLLFLIWRRWRFVAGFMSTGVLMLAISLGLTGTQGFATYLHSLAQMSSQFSAEYGALYGIHLNLMPNFRGLAAAVTSGAPSATLLITAALSIFALAWTATRRPSLPLALLAAILVSFHHLITDATVMALPVCIVLAACVSKEDSYDRHGVAILAGFILIAPGLLLLAGDRFYLLAIPVAALLFLAPQVLGEQAADRGEAAQMEAQRSVPELSSVR
jgi:hypothetical protein